tara:strand:- start:23 stop:937 length:915 start_codon:yes stop_codon:yes gene_type:complete
MSNKHDFTARPMFTKELWGSFVHRVVMGGMGDDTVMMIAEMYERGFEPDEIVFCDTGSEFPHTYEFIKFLQKWCIEKEWSKVVILKKLDKFDQPLSVISMVSSQNTLPAAAFGSKSCSLRFKVETADKYFNNNPDCWKAWGVKKKGVATSKHKGKILRLVGINFDEPERVKGWKNEPKWTQAFPLFDWVIGEAESEAVERVGLYYPGKSSCTICPYLTHGEIAMLYDDYPIKYQESITIEDNYRKHNLIKSDQVDLFGDDSFDNTVLGLGGRNGKTRGQMLKEYQANPQHYKQSTNKKPCECGH